MQAWQKDAQDACNQGDAEVCKGLSDLETLVKDHEAKKIKLQVTKSVTQT